MCQILSHGIPLNLSDDPKGEYNYPHLDEQVETQRLKVTCTGKT